MSQEDARTFEEWNDVGCYVRKGEKAAFFRDGKAYFTEEQVEECFDDYADVYSE